MSSQSDGTDGSFGSKVWKPPTRRQRQLQGGSPDDINVIHHPPSHWRRLYKRGLARQQEAMSQSSRVDQAPRYNIEDCSRCFLQKRGVIMIPDSCVCTCAIVMPSEKTELVEEDAEAKDDEVTESEGYMNCLTMSVTLGSVKAAPALYQNDSPARQIKERRISEEPIFARYENNHVCEQVSVSYSEDTKDLTISKGFIETADWMGNSYLEMDAETRSVEKVEVKVKKIPDKETKTQHALIFAPPGCGKTTLQQKMFNDNVVLLDTDDMPGCRVKDIKDLLCWTSVLTNRLDLVVEDYPVVMFVPKNPETLMRFKAPQLLVEDYQYWHSQISNRKSKAHLAIIYDHSYVSDWFRWKSNKTGKFSRVAEEPAQNYLTEQMA